MSKRKTNTSASQSSWMLPVLVMGALLLGFGAAQIPIIGEPERLQKFISEWVLALFTLMLVVVTFILVKATNALALSGEETASTTSRAYLFLSPGEFDKSFLISKPLSPSSLPTHIVFDVINHGNTPATAVRCNLTVNITQGALLVRKLPPMKIEAIGSKQGKRVEFEMTSPDAQHIRTVVSSPGSKVELVFELCYETAFGDTITERFDRAFEPQRTNNYQGLSYV